MGADAGWCGGGRRTGCRLARRRILAGATADVGAGTDRSSGGDGILPLGTAIGDGGYWLGGGGRWLKRRSRVVKCGRKRGFHQEQGACACGLGHNTAC